jgi:hypothetical protein
MGCSLFYNLREQCYRLGGSSRDRLQMDRTASYYDLKKETSKKSFTGYSLLHNVELSFYPADFQCSQPKEWETNFCLF